MGHAAATFTERDPHWQVVQSVLKEEERKQRKAAKDNLVDARNKLGTAAAAGNAQAAAIIEEYEQAHAQAASTPEISRLRTLTKYELLDGKETRREFDRLNAALSKLGNTLVYTIDQSIPLLSDVQTLTSQRGGARKKVLQEAKLPEWKPYLQQWAERYGVSIRTLQRKIAEYRGKKSSNSTPIQSNNTTPKTTKAESDIDAELRRRRASDVEAAESYIRVLEGIVYSSSVTLTQDQRDALQRASERWRKLLRDVRGMNVVQDEEKAA